jgi:hypothetical protein
MSKSVIVTSYNSPRILAQCLESLREQTAAEIVVADCSDIDPALDLAPAFPDVKFLHFHEKRTVPQLRWRAFFQTTGELIAAVEARCVPSPTWSKEIEAAHHRYPGAVAIGGSVSFGGLASPFAWGLYLCEYGAYAPPIEEGQSWGLSAANLSFKRGALTESLDVLRAGKWETALLERWLAQGRLLCVCSATVAFQNTMTPSTALSQRFWYGRGYAAERVVGSPLYLIAARAVSAPALPVLLSFRLWRTARAKRLQTEFWRSALWILFLQSAWALGEFVGYAFGPPKDSKIF